MVSVTALLVVGVAGAAVHEDEADNGVASALDDPETAAPAGSAPTSTQVATTVTTNPSTSTSTTTGFVPETLAGSAGAASPASPAGAASPAGSSDAVGTTASGSAPVATGNGQIASGGPPLADTGSYPLALSGALLLALGGAGWLLVRRSSRATG